MSHDAYLDATSIRSVVLADWPELWPFLGAMGGVQAEAEVHARLEQTLRCGDHFLAVAVAEGGWPIVGYAWAQDYGPHLRTGTRIARLHDLFVAPTHRRQGIGRRLFDAVTRWADDRGVTWLQWQASRAAVPFYERLGFVGDPCPDREHPFFEIEFARAERS